MLTVWDVEGLIVTYQIKLNRDKKKIESHQIRQEYKE